MRRGDSTFTTFARGSYAGTNSLGSRGTGRNGQSGPSRRKNHSNGPLSTKKIVDTVYETTVTRHRRFQQGQPRGMLPTLSGHAASARCRCSTTDRPCKAKVKKHLERAAQMKAGDGAFELRYALDAIQNDIAPPKEAKKDKPLWERLGGETAVRKVVHEFVAAAANNNDVNFLRDGEVKIDAKGVEHLEQMIVELVSVTTGGPLKYTGKDMKTVHKGMAITDKEFDALGRRPR